MQLLCARPRRSFAVIQYSLIDRPFQVVVDIGPSKHLSQHLASQRNVMQMTRTVCLDRTVFLHPLASHVMLQRRECLAKAGSSVALIKYSRHFLGHGANGLVGIGRGFDGFNLTKEFPGGLSVEHYLRFFFFSPASLYAIATACLTGLPARTSAPTFLEKPFLVFAALPFSNGIVSSLVQLMP